MLRARTGKSNRLGTRIAIGTVLAAGSLFAGTMNPVDVTGWEEDIVIGVGETYSSGATAQMDNPATGSGATVWYGIGKNTSAPATGLPTELTRSETTADLYFQLQSFGSAGGTSNNALYEGGTLTLTAATNYTRIALIGATGQGTSDLTITFKYTTGADDVFSSLGSNSINQDWFNGGSIAYTADGRISTVSGSYEYVDSGNPRLYENIFTVDKTRLLQSVVITDNAGDSNPDTPHHSVIMAISGEVIPEPATTGLIATVIAMALFYRRFFGRA